MGKESFTGAVRQIPIQASLEHLHVWGLHNLLSNLFHYLTTLTVKKFLPNM